MKHTNNFKNYLENIFNLGKKNDNIIENFGTAHDYCRGVKGFRKGSRKYVNCKERWQSRRANSPRYDQSRRDAAKEYREARRARRRKKK